MFRKKLRTGFAITALLLATDVFAYKDIEAIKKGGEVAIEIPDPDYFGKIKLSDEKKKQIRMINVNAHLEREPFDKEMVISGSALNQAIDNPDTQERDLWDLYKKHAAAKAKLEEYNFKVMLAVRKVMTIEELASLVAWLEGVREQRFIEMNRQLDEQEKAEAARMPGQKQGNNTKKPEAPAH